MFGGGGVFIRTRCRWLYNSRIGRR